MASFLKRVLTRLRSSKPVSLEAGLDLPPEFDPDYYRRTYPDLADMDEASARSHFWNTGRIEGRSGSPAATRDGFVSLIDPSLSALEIGPMANPVLRGPNVRYLDVVPTEELRRKADACGMDGRNCPEIDYVSPNGDLAVIDEQFEVVVSCHSIEHQPNLVAHLQGVTRVLRPGGRYFVIVPDKRYCFDHFLRASSMADVLDAEVRQAKLHSARSVIEHLAMTTHNEAHRHWNGDHGEARGDQEPELFGKALKLVQGHPDHYLDCHAWQFTPDSLRRIMQGLYDLGLTELWPVRVFETICGALEFYAILEYRPRTHEPDEALLPDDFDAEQYLAANPDVADAGVSAEYHYRRHGHREGRPLRPL